MNFEDRVKAVAEFRFTERQARFLVTVMLHAGVCVPRQYARFAGIAYGHKVSRFFDRLVQRGYATVCGCLHNRAELYHVRHHALYCAMGQPHSRYRRAVSARLAIDRLMRLDSIVMFPELVYLATEAEKVAFFGVIAPALPRERLPHVTVGSGISDRVRLFPDDQPIGVESNGRVVFSYAVSAGNIQEFRAFVQRHTGVLQAVSGWTLRVLFSRPSAGGVASFDAVARDELASPLRPETLAGLKQYFNQRGAMSNRAPSFADEEYWSDRSAFSAPRFQQLYRRWLTDGDSVFEPVSSPAIAEALKRGTGRIESHILPFSYRHFSPLGNFVSRPVKAVKGVEKGDTCPAPPQPPPAPSLSISEHLTREWYRSIGRT